MVHVIFVCMGNICRSPMAEAVFCGLVADAGLSDQFSVDSAGTIGYHSGQPAHSGTKRILKKHKLDYLGCSRKISLADFEQADYLIAMDDDNVAALQLLSGRSENTAKIAKLLDFATKTNLTEVPDPYYLDNFDQVYQLVLDGCQGLLAHLRNVHHLS